MEDEVDGVINQSSKEFISSFYNLGVELEKLLRLSESSAGSNSLDLK